MDLDFSQLNLSSIPDGISQREIVSVLDNPNHRLREILGYPRKYLYTVATGYSSKKGIIMIASRIIGIRRQLLDVKVADELEIQRYFCGV
jgi:hypothetical protein